jgi:hypothetical protein
MVWQKKYRWSRTWPDDRDEHDKVPEDYLGLDGEQIIGRIYLDRQTLKNPARDVSTATRPELPLDILVPMGVFRKI